MIKKSIGIHTKFVHFETLRRYKNDPLKEESKRKLFHEHPFLSYSKLNIALKKQFD